MRSKLAIWIALVSLCRADTGALQHFYNSVLAGTSGSTAETKQAFEAAMDSKRVQDMSIDEIRSVLPLADKCLASSRVDVQEYGLLLFISTEMRWNNASLLPPYSSRVRHFTS